MVYDVVGGKFKILRKIGVGSFSEIFSGVDIRSGEEVAIKREPVETENPQLFNESEMYRNLKGGVGIPSLKWFGVEGEYRFLVIELLGPSLEDLLKRCGGRFSLKTVLMLADQIIDTISYMRKRGVIHRDIKPGNFLMGLGSNVNKVYLIDFGLARFYSDPISNEHIPYREDTGFMGTDRYASLYTHFGIEQSGRDDAESLCFVLMYLLKGSLPWQGLCVGSDEEENNVKISYAKYYYTIAEHQVGNIICKAERILATQDNHRRNSLSDEHSRNRISDDVPSSKEGVSNDGKQNAEVSVGKQVEDDGFTLVGKKQKQQKQKQNGNSQRGWNVGSKGHNKSQSSGAVKMSTNFKTLRNDMRGTSKTNGKQKLGSKAKPVGSPFGSRKSDHIMKSANLGTRNAFDALYYDSDEYIEEVYTNDPFGEEIRACHP